MSTVQLLLQISLLLWLSIGAVAATQGSFFRRALELCAIITKKLNIVDLFIFTFRTYLIYCKFLTHLFCRKLINCSSFICNYLQLVITIINIRHKNIVGMDLNQCKTCYKYYLSNRLVEWKYYLKVISPRLKKLKKVILRWQKFSFNYLSVQYQCSHLLSTPIVARNFQLDSEDFNQIVGQSKDKAYVKIIRMNQGNIFATSLQGTPYTESYKGMYRTHYSSCGPSWVLI